MSWMPDGRGSFVRNNSPRPDEEVDETAPHLPHPPTSSSVEDEEEGEIAGSGGSGGNGGGMHPPSNTFRPRFGGGGGGRGGINNRPFGGGGRHRHHGNLPGASGNAAPVNNNAGPPPFLKREGSFGGRGGGGAGFAGNRPGDFRSDGPYEGGPRDFRADGGPLPARDFNNFRNASDGSFRPDEPPPPNFRDRGSDALPSRDFSGPREPFGGTSQRQPFRDGAPPFRGADRGRPGSISAPPPFAGGRPQDIHREGSFGTGGGAAGAGRSDPRESSFGSRSGDMEGPPRDLPREGSFGPRGGDMGGPQRDSVREGSFGPRGGDMGAPPRDLPREGSFGPRGGDMGGPPRDLVREGSFGPRGGDGGGLLRDLPREVSHGPRGTDVLAGSPRDHGRDVFFESNRGPDITVALRELGPRGPITQFPRGGPPPPRDNGPPPAFLRSDGTRESTFGDLAGPPPSRDRPFHDDAPPRGRVSSHGPPGPSQGGFTPSTAPSDPRRPTDPRRRSAQDVSGGLPSHVSSEGFSDGTPMPSPQAGRRISSYSSLADSSTIPPNLMPSQPSHMAHDGGPATFRSPGGRRSHVDHNSRNDRGADQFGGGPRSSWSPALDRRAGSSPRTVPHLKSPGFNNNLQGGNINNGPPLAPSLSSRGVQANFRDPRFKTSDKIGGDHPRPDVTYSGPSGGFGGHVSKKSFSEGPDFSTNTASDAFGRARKDCSDRPPTQKSPRSSSPPRTQAITTFPPSSRGNSTNTIPERKPSESSTAAPLTEDLPASKRESSPPLLTSALGDLEIVQRAESAVFHLSEVVGNKELKAVGDELSKLPAKQMIMAAVTTIEKLIKEAQKDLETCEAEKKEAEKEEAEAHDLEKKRFVEDEAERMKEESERLQEEKKRHEELKTEGLQKAFNENQDQLREARKKFYSEYEQKLQRVREDEKRLHQEHLDAKISSAEEDFDKDILKARHSLNKAQSSAARVEGKLAAAQSQYELLLENVQSKVEKPESGCVSSNKVSRSGNLPCLVEQIVAENNRKAKEVHILTFSMISENDQPIGGETYLDAGGSRDPQLGKSCEEWSVLTKQVTGLGDALYSEPSAMPYYQQNEHTHALIGPAVKEYIRDQKKQLLAEWTVLAEEYEVRKRLYEKQQRKLAKKAQRSAVSVSRQSILAGVKESTGAGQGIDRGNILESGSRTSNNPYRRARRGNEVRSEYEQEQIIAEIAAKEAMEKRISHGGCKLPRQVTRLERGLTASFVHTFTSYKVDDPLKEANDAHMNNVWTDMEKCIFLDRFLQFPKDFRRIASFLRNKTTKDCVAFYYDSKQTVPYKGALKEHVMRRKRKGDYSVWDSSIQAAISVGATVKAGESEEKPVEFLLPPSDKTFKTYMLHPLRRLALDGMPIDEDAAKQYDGDSRSEETKWKSRKRGRDPLFTLDKKHTNFWRTTSQESMSSSSRPQCARPDEDKALLDAEPEEPPELSAPSTPIRKAPQKWTTAEKRIFAETLEKHGRDWAKLAKAIGTKNEKQIKNFYYDWKKGKSRPPSEKKGVKKEKTPKIVVAKKLHQSTVEESAAEVQKTAVDERAEERFDLPATFEKAEDQDDHGNPTSMLTDQSTQFEARNREQEVRQRNESADDKRLDGGDYLGGNRDLIQKLLNQQFQHQQPRSALQQLLGQQHLQREQQHQQQQLNQLSLEDARRLLEHHQSQRGPVLSNLLSPPWLGGQMIQGQPAGLSTHAIASSLRGEGNALGGGGISEMGDLQRVLQMHQASQGLGVQNRSNNLASLLLGAGADLGGSSAGSNYSTSLLQQLTNRGANGGPSPDPADHLVALANAQALLGFGAVANTGSSNLANTLYRQGNSGGMDPGGVPDALSLLARSMQRGSEGNSLGFGRLQDRSDGSGRYN